MGIPIIGVLSKRQTAHGARRLDQAVFLWDPMSNQKRINGFAGAASTSLAGFRLLPLTLALAAASVQAQTGTAGLEDTMGVTQLDTEAARDICQFEPEINAVARSCVAGKRISISGNADCNTGVGVDQEIRRVAQAR